MSENRKNSSECTLPIHEKLENFSEIVELNDLSRLTFRDNAIKICMPQFLAVCRPILRLSSSGAFRISAGPSRVSNNIPLSFTRNCSRWKDQRISCQVKRVKLKSLPAILPVSLQKNTLIVHHKDQSVTLENSLPWLFHLLSHLYFQSQSHHLQDHQF
jgi:hypothetical protein